MSVLLQRLKESVGKMSEKDRSVMIVMSVKLLIMMEKQGNMRSLYVGSDSSTLSTRGQSVHLAPDPLVGQ